jgi:hypothetical protein
MASFLWDTFFSGVWSAVLLSAAAFLLKGQIAHWLNKDMERTKASYQEELETAKGELQKHLEQEKAKHQRELEAYKVSLIADAERAKSAQELKKALALKIVEFKFAALDRYRRAFLAARYDIATTAELPPHMREAEVCAESRKRLRELIDAENALDIFLTLAEQHLTFTYRKILVDRYGQYLVPNGPVMNAGDRAAADEVRRPLSVQIENLLRDKILEMQAL